MNKDIKVINSYWFTPMIHGTIGIIVVENILTKEHRAYIGICSGANEAIDTELIVDFGTPIYIGILDDIKKTIQAAEPHEMTHDEHIARHKALHGSLDELAADFIQHVDGFLPSHATVMELMKWSSKQAKEPDHKP